MTEENKVLEEELKRLATKTQTAIDSTLNWLQGKPHHIRDVDQVITEVKVIKDDINKVIPYINDKPGLAIFGASQVGKSNVVQNVLRSGSGDVRMPFQVYNSKSSQGIQFENHINPNNEGSEATACLTRFSTIDNSDKLLSSYPVRYQVFNFAELICYFVSGFYQTHKELDTSYKVTLEEFATNVSKDLQSYPLTNREDLITKAQVRRVKAYINKYTKGSTLLLSSLDNVSYWGLLEEKSPFLTFDKIIDFFSVLWINNPIVTSFFRRCAEGIKALDYSTKIYSDFDIILEKNIENQFSNVLNVLNVNTIKLNNTDMTQVFLENEKPVQLEADILCCLVKEVQLFTMPDISEDNLINSFDILDFPGEKAAPDNAERDLESVLWGIVLRGKVSFLFQSYSDEYRISSMLLVSKVDRSIDTQKIPKIIDSWVRSNVGSTPEDRGEYISKFDNSPLFVVLSFWNVKLQGRKVDAIDKVNESIQSMLKVRIETDITFGTQWMTSWTKSEQQFRDVYLLRDFKHCDLFSPIKDNVKEWPEIEIDPNEESKKYAYYNAFRTAFINEKLSSQYFRDPIKSFDSASTPDNDGSKLIIENLKKLDGDKLQVTKFLTIIKKNYDRISGILFNLYEPNNMSDKLVGAKSNALKIQNSFILSSHEVGKSISSLQSALRLNRAKTLSVVRYFLNDTSTYNSATIKTYSNILSHLGSEFDSLTSNSKKKLYVSDKFNQSIEDIEIKYQININQLLEYHKSPEVSLRLLDKVFKTWLNDVSSLRTSDDYKLLHPSIIIDSIDHNYHNSNIRSRVSSQISKYVDNDILDGNSILIVSDIIVGSLNNHVMTCGWYAGTNNSKNLNEARKLGLNLTNQDEVRKGRNSKAPIDLVKEIYASGDFTNETTVRNISKWRNYIMASLFTMLDSVNIDVDANRVIGTVKEELEI